MSARKVRPTSPEPEAVRKARLCASEMRLEDMETTLATLHGELARASMAVGQIAELIAVVSEERAWKLWGVTKKENARPGRTQGLTFA